MLGKMKSMASAAGNGMKGRSRSDSPSARLQRGRSSSPSSRLAPPPPPGRSGRSASPSSRLTGRISGRSNSPSSRIRGRSGSPSSRLAPPPPGGGGRSARSASPSSRLRGRSGSPSSRLRGRSGSPSSRIIPPVRGRSGSPSRRLVPLRGRSGSPSSRLPPTTTRSAGSASPSSRLRTPRSASPSSRLRGRSRSASPSRMMSMHGGQMDRRKTFGDLADKRGFRSSMRMLLPPAENCTFRKVCGYLAPIALLLLSSAGLVIATGNAARFTPDFLENIIPKFNNNDVVDPYSGGDGETTYAKWDNAGKSGLELEVLNAMSSSWDVWFSLVVADWEYGNPDSLTLPTKAIAEDKACKEVNGKLKVCNGDYGETKWRGINSATQDDAGFIISSAARMNEFYLNFDGEGAKQYTLCHEMGHGFGLTHTDEEFGNPDLGNCLDYTDNFNVNKHPDVSNYESLLGLYGPAGSRRRLLRAAPSSSSERRKERKLSQSFWDKVHESVEKLAARLDNNAHEDGWKLLHRTQHGEEHEMELEDGYKVRVHMLLAKK